MWPSVVLAWGRKFMKSSISTLRIVGIDLLSGFSENGAVKHRRWMGGRPHPTQKRFRSEFQRLNLKIESDHPCEPPREFGLRRLPPQSDHRRMTSIIEEPYHQRSMHPRSAATASLNARFHRKQPAQALAFPPQSFFLPVYDKNPPPSIAFTLMKSKASSFRCSVPLSGKTITLYSRHRDSRRNCRYRLGIPELDLSRSSILTKD